AAFILTLKNISLGGSADWAAAATYFHLGSTKATHEAAQAPLLRDIFGNPFRPVTTNPAWLTWSDGTVVKLGEAIYQERELRSGPLDLTRLAVLADALEDAGCADPDLLGHLRGAGPHVRGCWAVDLLLGKE